MKQMKKKINRFSDFYEDLKKAAELKKKNDLLSAIVSFFKAMSNWHNGNLDNLARTLRNNGQSSQCLGKLERFKYHVSRTSYKKGGINQTKNGQEVTEHTIFIGCPAQDIPPQSIFHWKEIDKQKESSNNCKRVYSIIYQQINEFLYQNMIPVVKVTGKIM